MSSETIPQIVNFWLGPSLQGLEAARGRRDFWYKGGKEVDDEIRERFEDFIPQACDGKLVDWQATPDGALALILLLDQFTRNLYRSTPDAYLGDPHAFEIVNTVIRSELDRKLDPVPRIWLYHPFHHSERVEEQDRGLALLNELLREASVEWKPHVERSIQGWTRHRNIVCQFGRFPHRNKVLGRASTKEEITFLDSNGESFGQGPRRIGDR
jgi:uncharacterized protein (DUF924 family)